MKKLFMLVLLIFVIVSGLLGCTNTSDGKCDICGKEKYTKLSDENEYCYTHWEDAIGYYLK